MISNNKEKIYKILDQAYAFRTRDISNSIALTQKALDLSEALNDKALIGKSLNK